MADNCEPRKIDSNRVGLSFAETICGRLPNLIDDGYNPTWFELEPNSFDDFGATLTTTARSPLSASRQRKKGTPTDLTAGGGFNQDYTKSNFDRLLQGFFFADARQKPQTNPFNGDPVVITGADTTGDTYTAASGLSRFRTGMLVSVAGFVNALNNGNRLITAVSDTAITVTDNLATEVAPAGVEIKGVGWQLGAAAVSITMAGLIPQLVLAATPVAATNTMAINTLPTAGEILTIGGVEYTYAAAVVNPYDILIGADVNATATNVAASINGNVIGTPAHPRFIASALADDVTFTARIKGTNSNGVSFTSDADVTFGGATSAGGTGFSWLETELIAGEWFYLGDDVTANAFANNGGYARVASITDTVITLDKTTWTPVAEVGTGKTIRIYTGDTIKNEKEDELVVTRYFEFERTLGKDADGTQSEYLTRSVANEFTLNIPLPEGEEAKLNADVSFVSGDSEQRSGAVGRKPGTFIAAPGEAAINTANNVVRLRMAIVDPATTRPTPLFAYVTEATISINNNVTPTKAVGTFGAIDVNVGDFDAGGELTAIFSTVAATKAVRDNADVTCDFIFAAGNAGFVYDFPLLTLGGGSVEVEAGQEIRVPLEMLGAENTNGYTLLYTNWSYLPTVAMPKQATEY
jgi:hypothetical protein